MYAVQTYFNIQMVQSAGIGATAVYFLFACNFFPFHYWKHYITPIPALEPAD